MFIAKMTTKYPEFHGSGYYNFLVEEDEVYLSHEIEENLHDFNHEKTVEVDEVVFLSHREHDNSLMMSYADAFLSEVNYYELSDAAVDKTKEY